ncbi:thermonuclease family protein [Pontibacter sp. 172403-2]|uniref:thermonuclease family protein n=1 Tax=Pontibacter rufus TaxID=2791028 RepID=UPI001E2B410F|nr:thermonuclease family protein [Pontibacter sp. 172403-2]
MKLPLYHLFLIYTLLATSCQHDRRDAQEQFRERQQAILERAQEQQPATSPTTAPTANTAPVDTEKSAEVLPEKEKPSAMAGDRVVAIKDGDTIVLLRNGEQITVRLYGVDTPEKTQDFGQKAKQFTSDLVFNKYVRLIPKNKDRYGRTVGTILLADGRSLNEELVRNGFAWHYKAYSTDKNLANLEADARRYKRGLWQSPNPTPPWDYRKDKRSGGSKAKQSRQLQQIHLFRQAPPGAPFTCAAAPAPKYTITIEAAPRSGVANRTL